MGRHKECNYVYKDGEKCDKVCFAQYDYCLGHYNEVVLDQEVPEEQSVPSAALASIPPNITTIAQVRDVMGIMIPQLVWGNMDPNVMKALTSACLAQVKIIELTDIVETLKKLEAITETDPRYVFTLDED